MSPEPRPGAVDGSSLPPKRRREGGGDGGSTRLVPAPPKGRPPFDSGIMSRRPLQEIGTNQYSSRARTGKNLPPNKLRINRPPNYKFRFLNSLTDEIFTRKEVLAANGDHIKIRMVASNQQGSNCPSFHSANVKILVLDGDFNADNRESWTSEEFDNHIVRPRDKAGAVIAGKLDIQLENGEADLRGINFIDNSRFTRSGKFRLGVRLIDDLGERVQEGITEPFTVKDRRSEGLQKRTIPSSDDEVWRLKSIAKTGVLRAKLEQNHIHSVKDFLRSYYKDEKALRNILKAKESAWNTIVEHAKMCDAGTKLYSHFIKERKIRLYFSSLGQIVGATIDGQYKAFSDLETPLKVLVEECSKDAYPITYDQADYEMCDQQETSKSNQQETSKSKTYGSHSQQSIFERLGSVQPRPSVHENNDAIVWDFEHSHPCLAQIARKVESMEQNQVLIKNQTATIIRTLGNLVEQIQILNNKVDRTTCSCHNHDNHEQLMEEIEQQGSGTEAYGLPTKQDENKSTTLRLRFLNEIISPIYRDDEIRSLSNEAMKIGIFDGDEKVKSDQLLKLKIEILALESNFPYDASDSWTSEEFSEHRAGGRDGNRNVLTGEGTTVQLINGECDLGSIRFREGSCRTRKGTFILGARVCDGEAVGFRVQEAITNPVVVQERRIKLIEKSYPPNLNDRVYRLDEIGKDGKYCERLKENNIRTVEDFLKALNKDPDNLAEILQIRKEHKPWEKMVRHARECCLLGMNELKSYPCTEDNVVLFFNCVHDLVGAQFCDFYISHDKFDPAQQVLVDKLRVSAFDHLDALRPDHVMTETDNCPRPLTMDARAGLEAAYKTLLLESSDEEFSDDLVQGHMESFFGALVKDEAHPSSIPDHHRRHNCQEDQVTQFAGQQQFSSASQRDWCQDDLFELSNSPVRITEDFPSGDMHTAQDLPSGDELKIFLEQLAHCVEQESVPMDIEGLIIPHGSDTFEASTSAHINMPQVSQQPVVTGAPGSALGGIPIQMQAPLPSNGASSCHQQALPPHH
ncbi:hypothetical protein ACP4OV_022790 [Aristida adscensionis]